MELTVTFDSSCSLKGAGSIRAGVTTGVMITPINAGSARVAIRATLLEVLRR